MDEAGLLFVRDGYEATSMRDIAAAVGIKAGSLYHHFASKDELLVAILHAGIDVMDDAFEQAGRDSAGLPAPDRIAHHVRAHLSALFENGPYTATHVTTFRTAPAPVRHVVVQRRDAYEERWNGLLVELRDAGAVRAGTNVAVARLALLGAMNASVEWFDPDRGSLDDLATELARLSWSGMAA
jgi:AcrR family transcriptional regulator